MDRERLKNEKVSKRVLVLLVFLEICFVVQKQVDPATGLSERDPLCFIAGTVGVFDYGLTSNFTKRSVALGDLFRDQV